MKEADHVHIGFEEVPGSLSVLVPCVLDDLKRRRVLGQVHLVDVWFGGLRIVRSRRDVNSVISYEGGWRQLMLKWGGVGRLEEGLLLGRLCNETKLTFNKSPK
jgi:hypothetical protein